MRVTKRDTPAASRTDIAHPHPRSSVPLRVGLLLLAFALGFVVHQQGWHQSLVAFATSFFQRPAFTTSALLHRSGLPALQVDMRFQDYQRLLDKRSQALRLGANVVSDQDYVPASVGQDDASIAVQMRLLEGPAETLTGEAWPFEVVTEGDGTLSGLRWFTLVPADATVLSTWGYLETLRQADLLSPRYHLVRLVLNGSSKGLYALEEQPTAEFLITQGRSGGIVAAFDQSAYWEAYARLGDALPGSGFQYAQIAADCTASPVHQEAGDAPVAPDVAASCNEAVGTLWAVQADEHAPSDGFDADKVGTFLALTTLWRGTSELDWRTVRLAYDPSTARFEPIGTGAFFTPVAPLPNSFTDDPEVQNAYIRALVEFSRPDYLTQLRADLGDDLEAMQVAVWTDLGYLELPWSALEAHQTVMRYQIAPSRTLSAYVEPEQGAMVLRLGNMQPFPVEIVSLDIGENTLLAVDPAWVTESDRASLMDVPDAVVLRAAVTAAPRSVRLRVPLEALPVDHPWDWQNPDQIRLTTRLFGLTSQNIVVPVRWDDPVPPFGMGERSP